MIDILANLLCLWKLIIFSILITFIVAWMFGRIGFLDVFKENEYYHTKVVLNGNIPVYFTLEYYLMKTKK